MKQLVIYFILGLILSSCIVRQPEYADYKTVSELKTGMLYDVFKDSIGIEPYYLKEDVLDGNRTYVFKYRTCQVKRIPLLMSKNKGIEVEGDFVDLLVTVNRQGQVLKIETEETQSNLENNTTIVDFDSLIRGITTMITVTLPAFLVFLSNGS
ncbi:MAG: hypothetical protein ACPGLV_08775 [Bacteroidia bacterium]